MFKKNKINKESVFLIIYSNSFFREENGYEIEERDIICSSCHIVIDRQKKYKNIDSNFK